MKSGLVLHFLTLVLTLSATAAGAAPSHPTPKDAQKGDPVETPKTTGHEIDDANLMIKEAGPAPDEARKTYYFPYRQALAPRLGMVYSTDKDNHWTYALGVVYTWPRYASPQAEIGADVVAHFGGHLNFAVKHTYFERNYLRPFFTWGLTHEVVPEDRLATFTNFENYYLRGSVGMETVIALPQSLRIELEGLAGSKKIMGLLWFGLSWAW